MNARADCLASGARGSMSVVIATRDRGPAILGAIEGLLASAQSGLEIHVVDQSRDDRTLQAIRPHLSLPAIHYIASRSRGLGAARNVGIERSSSEYIALTDDDCRVSSTWLRELRLAFEVDARIGVVFGKVVAAAHDSERCFIPAYERRGDVLATSLAEKHKVEGIGACMALRRSVWTRLGGFDPMLGAGSRFRSAEELDFVLRALGHGFAVYETDRAEVVHHGLRELPEKSQLAYDYCFGIGAAYAKHLKCWNWRVLQALMPLAVRWALGAPVVSYGSSPPRWVRLKGFCAGVRTGIGTPVHHHALLYKLPSAMRCAEVSD